MEEIKKYIVHSNIDDKNICKEFDNAEDAIKYAKDNIVDETSVEAVICEESCEKFTIWSYEDGNYLDQDFPESDIANIKDVDDPEYAELEKEYDKLDRLDFSEAIKQLEENEDCVECTMCLENTPKNRDLIIDIKRRKTYTRISMEYDFSNDKLIDREFDHNTAVRICELFEGNPNISYGKIFDMLGLQAADARERRSLLNKIGSIKLRKAYTDISKNYKW